MLKINEKVIYPGYGVAVIEEEVDRVVAGNTVKFFKLRFLYRDMSVFVPINNVDHVSIRYLSSLEDIKSALNELRVNPDNKLKNFDFTPSGWNKRNKEYQLKIESSSIVELAKVYRDLMFVSKKKELSFGEKSLLNTTEDLIAQEIEVVTGKERDSILSEIRSPFNEYVAFSVHQSASKQTVSSL